MVERLPLPAKVGLVGEILWTYARVRRALRGADFPTALERVRNGVTRDAVPTVPLETGLRLGRAVNRTLSLLPTDSRCLMQATVLTALLARRGTLGTVVIGVKSGDGFAAHAWVELDGQPLLPPFPGQFSRLVDL